MEPYGLRLRMLIMELYEQEKSTVEIAKILGTSQSGTRRVRQHERERGTLEPGKGGGGGKPALDEQQQQQLRDLVKQQPDATLAELQVQLRGATGVSLSISSVDRWCTKLDLRLKKSRKERRSNCVPM
jgi:transposase